MEQLDPMHTLLTPTLLSSLLKDASFDPSIDDNCLIRYASEHNLEDQAKELLNHPKVNPSARNDEALEKACINGHHRIVHWLLYDVRVDPFAKDYVGMAIAHGHTKVVKELTDRYPSLRKTTKCPTCGHESFM